MSNYQDGLKTSTAATQVLLDALSQLEQFVVSAQVDSTGNPSKTAIYMQMPQGFCIDPAMFAYPWTPSGDVSSSVNDDGRLVTPPATAPAAPGVGGAAATPSAATLALELAYQSAVFTANLVDEMLVVSQEGIAQKWEDRHISVEYNTILHTMTASQGSAPAPDVQARIDAAKAVLQKRTASGTFFGYSDLYAAYKVAYKEWTDAVGALGAGYIKAMNDPVAGAAWSTTSASLNADVRVALDDLTLNGKQEVEAALDTLASVGEDATAYMISLGNDLFRDLNLPMGQTAMKTLWSYISPVSWWDHTDESFGVEHIVSDSGSVVAGGGNGATTTATNSWAQRSSAVSGGVHIGIGPFSAGGDASKAESASAFRSGQTSDQWENHSMQATSAHVEFEYFIATIERPWFFGDLFNIKGWYLVNQNRYSISTGSIADQAGDKVPQLLPMVPRAFVVVRNVMIRANEWGSAASSFAAANASSSAETDSSSSSIGVSVGYLFSSGAVGKKKSSADGSTAGNTSIDGGWSFTTTNDGGQLNMPGAQIVGWIGEIQPPSPLQDSPPPTPAQPAAH